MAHASMPQGIISATELDILGETYPQRHLKLQLRRKRPLPANAVHAFFYISFPN